MALSVAKGLRSTAWRRQLASLQRLVKNVALHCGTSCYDLFTSHRDHRLSNLPPEKKELPLLLRVDRQLSQNPESAARPDAIAQTRQDRSPQAEDATEGRSPGFGGLIDRATAINLGMTGIALATGFGWFLERRLRIARGDVTKAPVTVTATDVVIDAATDADAANDADAESSEPQFATVPTSPSFNWFVSVPRRKQLIAFLMGMRLFAGAMAIFAAVVVIVFWSIESTELGPRDMSLTWNLLVALFAGWVGFWGFGWLANRLHRATFNRVHPKFDT